MEPYVDEGWEYWDEEYSFEECAEGIRHAKPLERPKADWEKRLLAEKNDSVAHPSHYTSHPSGVECINITEHMGFLEGNALKYLWRAGLKTDDPTEDYRKAIWYLERKVKQLEADRRN
ncbi:DUF3310 domain-containing protein [Actinomadura oligospora]|uniref:DUF3310 domain-containing protein n=1 Tax=Actinomadura oligospora TaxID=111804 RepID=UPI0009FCC94D|nr:DUF3310 domain-containing protein [Actinomadura oligospora]